MIVEIRRGDETREEKELQVIGKKELDTHSENIRNMHVFTPPVDICESENEVILADMPGVPIEAVEIDRTGDLLTIRGRSVMGGNGNRAVLWNEYQEGGYYRQFNLSEAVDRNKINATIKR